MLSLLIDKIWPYLIGLASLIAGLFYARRLGKAEGRKEVEAEQVKSTLKGMEHARNARSEIDSLSDDAVRDRARQRMRNRAK